jgi:hypothetical protein
MAPKRIYEERMLPKLRQFIATSLSLPRISKIAQETTGER